MVVNKQKVKDIVVRLNHSKNLCCWIRFNLTKNIAEFRDSILRMSRRRFKLTSINKKGHLCDLFLFSLGVALEAATTTSATHSSAVRIRH